MKTFRFILTILLIVCLLRSLNGIDTAYTLDYALQDIQEFQTNIYEKTTFGKIVTTLQSVEIGEGLTWDDGAGFFRNLISNVRNIAKAMRYYVSVLVGGIFAVTIEFVSIGVVLVTFILDVCGFIEYEPYDEGRHGGR